jgi:hypothetical protein
MPHNSTTSSFGFTLFEFAGRQNEEGTRKNQTCFVFTRFLRSSERSSQAGGIRSAGFLRCGGSV